VSGATKTFDTISEFRGKLPFASIQCRPVGLHRFEKCIDDFRSTHALGRVRHSVNYDRQIAFKLFNSQFPIAHFRWERPERSLQMAVRTLLKNAVDQLKDHSRLNSLALEPVIVPRMDKLPVIVRIWPFDGPAHQPGQDVRALLTLNALGPRPGPSAAILAKTFRLTPSEAKVACIIARGTPPDIAARELKISRETARNQLKAVFAKTDTHRQSELVALLLQVE
jgi:DNA-binding CsgD family transcriptional regulator